jgi:methoxymalonate biosynthesis acyl carrier protein
MGSLCRSFIEEIGVGGRHQISVQADSILEDLRRFFSAALPGDAFTVDDDYFALGHANSLFALELITFVERHFSITVDVTDLELENFRTIARTAEFVRRKLTVAPSSLGHSSGHRSV